MKRWQECFYGVNVGSEILEVVSWKKRMQWSESEMFEVEIGGIISIGNDSMIDVKWII